MEGRKLITVESQYTIIVNPNILTIKLKSYGYVHGDRGVWTTFLKANKNYFLQGM